MEGRNDNHKYDSILHLPHHVSTKRPQMPMLNRAAQFAPFAALTGYEDAIRETGRRTDEKIELSEEELNVLNRKYQVLVELLEEEHEVSFTYFVPDGAKSGGAYVTKQGIVKKIDGCKRRITLSDGTNIPMDDILEIDGGIFNSMESL